MLEDTMITGDILMVTIFSVIGLIGGCFLIREGMIVNKNSNGNIDWGLMIAGILAVAAMVALAILAFTGIMQLRD